MNIPSMTIGSVLNNKKRLNEIEAILKRRDNLTDTEAREAYQSFLDDCRNIDNLFEMEELLENELGLEPDYMMTVLSDLSPEIV